MPPSPAIVICTSPSLVLLSCFILRLLPVLLQMGPFIQEPIVQHGRCHGGEQELRGALEQWAGSFESGDLHRHLSLYADDFSYRGMNREEWAAFRAQSLSQAPPQDVVLKEVLLLADPEYDGLYLSRFKQSIAYGDRTVVTMKRLYWRRLDDGTLAIVAEDNG